MAGIFADVNKALRIFLSGVAAVWLLAAALEMYANPYPERFGRSHVIADQIAANLAYVLAAIFTAMFLGWIGWRVVRWVRHHGASTLGGSPSR
ncbi:hypothetical protein BH10PSE14_BH10PSE14_06910 [soil metagenome]